MTWRAVLCFSTIVAASLSVGSLVRAQDSVKSARIEVDAPAECTNESAFEKALLRRTDRVVPSKKNGAIARIEVSVRKEDRGVVGEIVISQRGTRSERRRIVAATCEEATMGLSLIAALAFDPSARIDVEPSAGASSSASSPSSAPASAAPAASLPAPNKNELGAVAAPPKAESASTDRSSEVVAPAEKPSAPRNAPAWRFGVGALGGVNGLGAATLAYGGFVDLERDRVGLAPSFRLGGLHSEGSADGGLAGADLAWTYARAQVCPVRIDPFATLSLRPCAGFDGGVVSARATGIAKTSDRSRPWLAPSLTARVAWAPVRAIFIELQAGAAVPLVRDEFAVDPSVSLYRAPVLVPRAEFGAGVRFP